MKKIALTLIALTISIIGYSQVRKVSKNDTMIPAQMQLVSRSEDETLQNVQSAPNQLRTDGNLDYTTYDWQSNAGAINRTIVWPDGKVSFAYTVSSNTSYSDRGTGIATYNPNTGVWSHLNGRVENEKTGFGSIARYGTNGIVIAAHTANECKVYIANNKDNISPNSLSAVSTLNNTHEPTWPVVMTSGANRNIIHIVATAYSENGQPLYYFRSQNGGQTWDKQNIVLPYLGSNYVSDWGSNIAYWMETTEDNCLALVVNNAWSDGMVIYSYDNGETWQRKVFWHHPGINTTFSSTFLYPRWTSCQWDNNHHLHVLYEFNGCTGEPGSGSYYPGIGGVAYWNETMPYRGYGVAHGFDPTNPNPPVHGQPFIMDSAYIWQDIYASWWAFSDATHEMWPEYVGYLPALTDGGEWENPYNATSFNINDRSLHGHYNSGCVAMPVLCMVPGTNNMVAVWCAMDENNMDGNGNYYFKLFASYSGDGGNTWSNMVHLTNDFVYSYSECVYPQAAVVGNELIIAVQMDGETGTYVQSDDSDPYDNYYQGLTFDLYNLFGVTPTQNYTITATASPSNAGTITGAGTYAQGSTCTLHANANSGYTFVNWIENGVPVSTNPNYSFTVTGNRSLVAVFDVATTNYTVTASASPTGSGFVEGQGTYSQGSTCTLTATPNTGYEFVKWEVNGTTASYNPTYSFTVWNNTVCIAFFQQAASNYTITATANPTNGGTVSGGGSYASGSTCTLTATANNGYHFEKWTLNGTQVSTNSNYSFTVTGNASYVAHFSENVQEYTVTVSASPTNGGVASGAGVFPEGSVCVVTATPNPGYVFDYWTKNDAEVSSNPTYSFVVNSNSNLVAHFTQDANHVTITAIPDPIDGGAVYGGGTYELGATCTLSIFASVGYEFVNWTLNGSQVSAEPSFSFTVTTNAVYTAHFVQTINHYTIAANVEPSGAGSIVGTGTYEEGVTCTLTATPNPTYSFVSWKENGTVVSTESSYSFTVNRDRNFIATFSQGQFYTISASAVGAGTISPEGDVFVEPGEDKTFAMIPNSGCRVGRVVVDGVDIGAVESYTFRSVNSNHTVYVQFSGVGVDETYDLDLKVYPNPASEYLIVEGPEMKEIIIYDLLGTQQKREEVDSEQVRIETNGLVSGAYIMKVVCKDGRSGRLRFVVAR